MEPRISVVIITLNEEIALPRLLQDLADQTDKAFEVLVVDAGSKDKTKEKAMEFKNKLNLHFIQSPRGQVSFQRNLGGEKAHTDYLFFLDADSRIESTVIEKINKHIKKEGKLLYLPTITPSINTLSNRMLFSASVAAVRFLHKVNRPMALGPLIVVHKRVFDKIKGFDEKVTIAEDHNFVIRAVKAGYKATFLPDVPVVYSMRRFEQQGKWNLIRQYAKYTAITLFQGGVYTKNKNEYKMGGQEFN